MSCIVIANISNFWKCITIYNILIVWHVGVLGMIVLCFKMQEEDMIEKTNAKHHVFTLMINLLIIMKCKHRPHIVIEHTNAKTLISTLERQVP